VPLAPAAARPQAAPPAPKKTAATVRDAVPGATLRLPAPAATTFRTADRAMRDGDFDDAARSYTQAALAAPDEPVLRMAAGVALANVRQLAPAADQFARAVALADDDLIAALQYQAALTELGDADRAEAVNLDAVRRFKKTAGEGLDVSGSVARLRGAVAAFPESPILNLLLGDACQMQGQWADADKAYRRAIALAPSWAKPRANYGVSRLSQGKPEEAILSFQAALARDPNNAFIRLNKADALRETGQNAAAIDDYRKIEKDPKFGAQAAAGIAQAYAASGKLPEAIQNANRAQRMAPRDAAAQAALADVQAKAGNFEAAAEAYESALRLTKEEGLFGSQEALYRLLAETQIAARNADGALATVGRALADEPAAAWRWHRLGAQAYLQKGDADRAEAEFKASLDADPSLYPYETLRLIGERNMLVRLARAYQADLDAAENGGLRIRNGVGGGSNVSSEGAAGARGSAYNGTAAGGPAPSALAPPVVVIGPAPASALTPEGQARSHAGLAVLARYRGDFNEELRRRESVTRLRSRSLDWYLLGEAADRASNPAKSLPAYQRALNLGGLPETLAAKARARVRSLTGVTR
jgi:superkiller protein 3